jgi:hypothetical protein
MVPVPVTDSWEGGNVFSFHRQLEGGKRLNLKP